jgi:hypothetical protein
MFSHIKKNTPSTYVNKKEIKIIKYYLEQGYRDQDIAFIIGYGRKTTINQSSIQNVKKKDIIPATLAEVEEYLLQKKQYNIETNLHPEKDNDKYLIKSREAMLSAIQAFNNPMLTFKSEQFLLMSQVAWIALLQHYLLNNGHSIYKNNNFTLSYSEIIKHSYIPLSDDERRLLADLSLLRNEVEHNLGQTKSIDAKFAGFFQASILNYNDFLIKNYGDHLSLGDHLSFALQFGKMDKAQVLTLNENENIAPNIQALYKNMNDYTLSSNNHKYCFNIVYTYVKDINKAPDARLLITKEDPRYSSLLDVVIETEKNKFLPKEIKEFINKKGFPDFNMYNLNMLWKSNKEFFKDPDNKYGVFVGKKWYWYEKWRDYVLREVKKGVS